jgi:dedicator of cytokinesis protein 3
LKKDLYLVVQVIRLGRLLYTESSKKPLSQTYRRPHAVAVLPLAELLADAGGLGTLEEEEEREFPLKLYQSDEKDYGLWQHELVAKKSTSKFSLLSGQISQGKKFPSHYVIGPLPASIHSFLFLFSRCGGFAEAVAWRIGRLASRIHSPSEERPTDSKAGLSRCYHAR